MSRQRKKHSKKKEQRKMFNRRQGRQRIQMSWRLFHGMLPSGNMSWQKAWRFLV